MAKAIDRVIGKVAEQAKEELLNSLKEGYEFAINILEEAERETIEEISKIMREKKRRIDTTRTRIIGSAELAARTKNLQVTEEFSNRIFSVAIKRIADMDRDEEYIKAIEGMIRGGIEAIGRDEVIVHANLKDQGIVKKIASKLAKELNVKIKVDKDAINCAGGVIISTPDKTTIFSNTVEERLERMKPILRRKIADLVVRGG